MKVVLIDNVKGVGKKLEVVEVSEGYGRNFLIPRKLAKIADNQTLNEANGKKNSIEFKKETEKEKAIKIKEKLANTQLEFRLKAKEGKPYGSVTTKDISDKLAALQIIVDKRKIEVPQDIQREGRYFAKIKLYQGIDVELAISIKCIN